MNDTSRNTRTLIVSFVIAIMALIPLRFVEVGQMMSEQSQVLGQQVVLPEDKAEPAVLEEPYNEIENQQVTSNCISKEEATQAISNLQSQIEKGNLSSEDVNAVVGQMNTIQENTCK